MSLVRISALIVSIMGFSGIAFPQQQCKVAVVDMQLIITGSNGDKALSAKFDDRVREWSQKMSPVQREINTAQMKLNGQSARTPEETDDILSKTIQEKTAELNRTKLAATKDLDDYRESLLAPTRETASWFANQVAAERGIDSVMVSSVSSPSVKTPAGVVSCDITSEVKARMDAKSTPADPPK